MSDLIIEVPALQYREKITALLHKRIEAFKKDYRQNIGLIGKKGFGKTFFIEQFFKTYASNEFIFLNIDIEPVPLEFFVHAFASKLLNCAIGKNQLTADGELPRLIQLAKPFVPKTAKQIMEILSFLRRHENDKAFETLLNLTLIFQEEIKTRLVVVFDEFDRFDQWQLRDPFSAFGRAIMVQSQTLFLVTSSRPAVASSIFREKLPLLFGNFEILNLKPFDFNDAFLFLDRALVDYEVVSGVLSSLVVLSDGHPFYLESFIEAIKAQAAEKRTTVIDRTLIAQAFSRVLFSQNGKLFSHFTHLMQHLAGAKSDLNLQSVLVSLACGNKKLPQIITSSTKRTEDVKKYLSRLLEEGIVVRRGSFFVIEDYLFKFWLKNVYKRQWTHFGSDADFQKQSFETEVLKFIELTDLESRKDLTMRVEELLRTFQNDVVEFEKQRFQCPSFTDIQSRPSNGRTYPIVARSSRSRWFCQIAREKVSEEDIRSFAQESKKHRNNLNRKIMISPRGIDLNAKLLAQEERIAIWDLKDLNLMLDLYERPKVVSKI